MLSGVALKQSVVPEAHRTVLLRAKNTFQMCAGLVLWYGIGWNEVVRRSSNDAGNHDATTEHSGCVHDGFGKYEHLMLEGALLVSDSSSSGGRRSDICRTGTDSGELVHAPRQ